MLRHRNSDADGRKPGKSAKRAKDRKSPNYSDRDDHSQNTYSSLSVLDSPEAVDEAPEQTASGPSGNPVTVEVHEVPARLSGERESGESQVELSPDLDQGL